MLPDNLCIVQIGYEKLCLCFEELIRFLRSTMMCPVLDKMLSSGTDIAAMSPASTKQQQFVLDRPEPSIISEYLQILQSAPTTLNYLKI